MRNLFHQLSVHNVNTSVTLPTICFERHELFSVCFRTFLKCDEKFRIVFKEYQPKKTSNWNEDVTHTKTFNAIEVYQLNK